MADIIRRIIVKGESVGLKPLQTELEGVTQATVDLGTASQQTSKVVETSSRRELEAGRALAILRRQIDEAWRSQQNLAKGTKTLDESMKDGSLSSNEHARLMGLLKARYDEATIAANKLAAATAAAATAQRSFTPMNLQGAPSPRGTITSRSMGGGGGGAAAPPPGMPPVDMIAGMGSVGGPALAKMQDSERMIAGMSGQMSKLGQSTRLTAFEVTNLGMQFNDIAVMAASGQNPMVLIMQQGMQLAQVLEMSSVKAMGLKGALAALGASLMTFLTNPMYLAVAAMAALAGAVMLFSRSFRDEILPLENILKRHEDLVKRITKQYELMQVSASVAAAGVPAVLAADIRQQQQQAQTSMMQSLKEGLNFAFPSGGLGGFEGAAPIPRHLAEFRAALQLLDAQYKAGKPDVKGFNEEVARIQATNPAVLDEWGNKLRAGAQDAALMAESLKDLNDQMNLLRGEEEGRTPRAGTTGTGEIARRQQERAVEEWAATNAHYAELAAIRAVTDEERLAAVAAQARAEALKDRVRWPSEELAVLRAVELEQARIDAEHRKEAEAEAKRRADEVRREAERAAEEKRREDERRAELLETARFEVSILNETEEQQAVLNALRELGADALAHERTEMEALTRIQFQYNEAIKDWEEKTKEAIGRMDEFRSSAKGVLSGFLEEGWKGAAEALQTRLMSLGEDFIIEGLFGKTGEAGGGLFGGAIQDLLGGMPEKPVATMNVVASTVNVNGGYPGAGAAPGSFRAAQEAGMTTGVSAQADLATAINTTAANLGINPQDLATVIAYETGGTFSPSIMGGKGGKHMGLIQFGPTEAAMYGASATQTAAEQMAAVEAYLRDRGLKPGMGLTDLYSTINAGRPGLYGASDRPGMTVSSHVAGMGAAQQQATDLLATAAATAAPAVDTLNNTLNVLEQSANQVVPGMGSLASSIANLLPGALGAGGISGEAAAFMAANPFGGFFQHGGELGAGKWGVAGEHGPEIIHGPANITPMQRGSASKFNVSIKTEQGVVARVTNAQQNEEGDFDLEIFAEALEHRVRDKYGLRQQVSRWGRA